MGCITRDERERRMALFEQGYKRCTGCDDVLPVEHFQPNARGWQGLHSRCKTCRNTATAERQTRAPEVQAERQKRWRKENRAAWLRISRRRDARKRELLRGNRG